MEGEASYCVSVTSTSHAHSPNAIPLARVYKYMYTNIFFDIYKNVYLSRLQKSLCSSFLSHLLEAEGTDGHSRLAAIDFVTISVSRRKDTTDAYKICADDV